MDRTSIVTLAWILSVAGRAAAAAPTPATPAPDAIPLATGDSVAFDLSGLPAAYEGEGRAVCTGTRILATGPAEVRCERPFRFDVPVDDARIVYTFRAKKGGRETRIELPITRSGKPITFVAKSEGTLHSPPPLPFPEEASERAARKAAGNQCGACEGEGFRLDSFEVTKKPYPPGGDFPIRLAITTKAPPAAAKK